MKLTSFKTGLLLAAMLAPGANAFAQQNPPGAQDYAAFSRFITDRNIFDPNRQPHYTSTYRPRTRPRSHVNQAPDLQLVGTMSYEKGLFAFFNGNDADLKQALPVAGKIAGQTILEISANQVRLESGDKKDQLVLKVGEGLRKENGRWVRTEGDSLPETAPASGTGENSNAAPDASATPASVAEPNEVLKRLMQLREKENQ
jgi:hypothetical protein